MSPVKEEVEVLFGYCHVDCTEVYKTFKLTKEKIGQFSSISSRFY